MNETCRYWQERLDRFRNDGSYEKTLLDALCSSNEEDFIPQEIKTTAQITDSDGIMRQASMATSYYCDMAKDYLEKKFGQNFFKLHPTEVLQFMGQFAIASSNDCGSTIIAAKLQDISLQLETLSVTLQEGHE